jgi:hypothetical protein
VTQGQERRVPVESGCRATVRPPPPYRPAMPASPAPLCLQVQHEEGASCRCYGKSQGSVGSWTGWLHRGERGRTVRVRSWGDLFALRAAAGVDGGSLATSPNYQPEQGQSHARFTRRWSRGSGVDERSPIGRARSAPAPHNLGPGGGLGARRTLSPQRMRPARGGPGPTFAGRKRRERA